MSQGVKQWHCPGCGVVCSADVLLNWKLGGKLGEVGGWYVRGRCPVCERWVQFTKHGAMLLRGPGKPGYAATVAVKNIPGRYME